MIRIPAPLPSPLRGEVRHSRGEGNRGTPPVPRIPSPGLEGPTSPRRGEGIWHRVADFVSHLWNPDTIWHNPAARPDPKATGLRVASYNIMLGGQKLAEVEAALLAQQPDVVLIQEASDESARHLAEKLGLHMTYMGSRFHPRGKAILSRYPIAKAEEIAPPGQGLGQRLGKFFAEWKKKGSPIKSIEPLQTRTVLHAQVKVGGKTVDLLDVHQSLAMTEGNTAQLGFLADLSRTWEREGRVVIAGGDFNTNFNFGQGAKADARGVYDTLTDTATEFADRYDGWTAGNAADPANRAALDRLKGAMQDAWTAPSRTVLTAGKAYTPEQAREALKTLTPGTPAFREMLLVADGASHKGARKRFDNVLVSRNAQVTAATIDHTAKGSDHQPVYADVAL